MTNGCKPAPNRQVLITNANVKHVSPLKRLVLCRNLCPPRSDHDGKTEFDTTLCKLAVRKTCEAVAMLMLLLVQINGFLSSYYQTQIKNSTVHPKQV